MSACGFLVGGDNMENLKVKDFDKIYRLMEESFVEDEYRNYEGQKQLLSLDHYTVFVEYHETGDVMAFIALWAFDAFIYIEHFVVNPKYRNRGLGSKLLMNIMDKFDKRICLEVEPPEDELKSRRIEFYRRNGFYLNDYAYTQPPLSKGKQPLSLKIMTSHESVDEAHFNEIKALLYKYVYMKIDR